MLNEYEQVAAALLRRDDDDDDCNGNEFDGRIGVRVSAIFVILVASLIGAIFPVLASRNSKIPFPKWAWFVFKYFGSGVIIATAFIHLLDPATESLGSDCLSEGWQEYPYAFAIVLITLFLMLMLEFVSEYYIHKADPVALLQNSPDVGDDVERGSETKDGAAINDTASEPEGFRDQLVSIFILEFGVIFHSVFIGLALAVSGEEFNTLYVVLVFHQMFEGFGLGTRVAEANWPHEKRFVPYILGLGYALSTPIAIAIGLGVRFSYAPGSSTALITNGIFDSISAGILIYTGIVEFMAHEFFYSDGFRVNGEESLKRKILAWIVMAVGAGLMALLGKWA